MGFPFVSPIHLFPGPMRGPGVPFWCSIQTRKAYHLYSQIWILAFELKWGGHRQVSAVEGLPAAWPQLSLLLMFSLWAEPGASTTGPFDGDAIKKKHFWWPLFLYLPIHQRSAWWSIRGPSWSQELCMSLSWHKEILSRLPFEWEFVVLKHAMLFSFFARNNPFMGNISKWNVI